MISHLKALFYYFGGFGARRWYLQCLSTGDIAVFCLTINLFDPELENMHANYMHSSGKLAPFSLYFTTKVLDSERRRYNVTAYLIGQGLA